MNDYVERHGLPARIVNNPVPERLIAALVAEVKRQDGRYGPVGEGCEDDSRTRLALALIGDELEEAHHAWRVDRGRAGWSSTATEIMQVAAVAIRALRDAP